MQAEAQTADAMSTCGVSMWLSISGGVFLPRERSGVHVMLSVRPVRSYACLNVRPLQNQRMWQAKSCQS